MRKLAAAAAMTLALFFESAAQTPYVDSIAAKREIQCVQKSLSKYPDSMKFFESAGKAALEIQVALYGDASDERKKANLLEIREKYGGCLALFAMFNPVSAEKYEKAGRTKPPLTGSYEEQAEAVIKEVGWEIAEFNAENQRRALAASKRIRAVNQVINIIGSLPDAISADINIDSWNVSGRVWPRFSAGYGEQGTVVIRPNALPPRGGKLENESDSFRLYSFPEGGYVLLANYGTAYSSYSRDGLLRYRDFLEVRRDTVSERGSWRFGEFSKFISRLGNSFDGSVRFKVSRTATQIGDKPIRFGHYGFRGQNNTGPKRLAVAAYYDIEDSPDTIDNSYINAFNAAFNELSFGGQRRIMHLFSVTGHHGRHTGVMEIESPNVGYSGLYVILEESR